MLPHLVHKLRGFEELDPESECWIAGLAQRNRLQVRPREDLLREGDCTGPMHILLDGWAIRYKTLVDGRRQILSILLPGDLFDINGFMAQSMDHSIAALTPLKVSVLENDFLDIVRRDHSALEKSIWCDMHVSAAIQRELSTSLGQRTARERLAHLMCELFVRQRASKLTSDHSCAFHLTQIELADTLGMTPVYVNRTLQDLRREGLVQLENKVLTIFDLPRLKRLALFDSGYLRICEKSDSVAPARERGYAV